MAWTRRVLEDCLGVGRDERLLVLTDPGMEGLARELFEAARCDRSLMVVEPRERHGEEPPEPAAAAMRAADAVVALTSWSISHTRARERACRAGTRVASMPGATRETLERAVDVDYGDLRRRARELAERLTEAEEAVLITGDGARLRLNLSGREGIPDDGDLREPGSFGNLPAGEAFIAPVEGSAEGELVIDGSVAPDGRLDGPLRLRIREGRIVDADGPGDLEFLRLVREAEGGDVVCELGIGVNPGAKLCGNPLEDEKALGTVHVGFGDNSTFGGENASEVHLDAVIVRHRLYLDGERVSPP